VLEVKNTDWDLRALHRVIPNLRRHARQVWGYLEPLVVLWLSSPTRESWSSQMAC
jgi:hypothetical protein